jgi:hypothetical protein
MTVSFSRRVLSVELSVLLILGGLPLASSAQEQGQQASTNDVAPFSAPDLQKLVAPIALYPDALVAQVLGAATFPDQVQAADGWVQQNSKLTGSALMKAADQQPWDPSVKALTQFPSVLDNMTKNLGWTSTLGDAYHNQPSDVMAAVQTLRAQAKAAGNLKSGSQIQVVQQSPEVIVIQPANPQVVYVPQYNPTVVYGTPYTTPGYTAGEVAAASILSFGVGIAVGAAMSGCCGWGYSYWNCNWHGGTVVYGGGAYYGNNAWHGGYYGSGATAYGPNGTASAGRGYNPSTGTYARGATASGPGGSAAVGQAYNPNTGAYAATHQTSNANGNYGSSVVSKNGETAYTQHQTTAQGSAGSIQTSNGGKAGAVSGAGGNNAAVAEGANGNKYAASNGNVYKNTGSGWQQTQGTPSSRGYGGQEKNTGSTAFGGGGSGWQSRQESARGASSRSAGGGGGRRR